MIRKVLFAWTGFCSFAFLVVPACQLHAQRAPVPQEWTVQAMWFGMDKVPYDGGKSPPRETYPDAASAKRAAQSWCNQLTAWKGVAKLTISTPFRAPDGETHMPYRVCEIDALTYVAVYGFKK